MKIMHMVWGLEVGGLESMLVDIVNEQAVNQDVVLMVINEEVDSNLLASIDKRARIILINRRRNSRNLYYWLRFIYHVLRIRPDVFHAHQAPILELLKFSKGCKVATIHETGIQPRSALRTADRVFCISHAVLADISPKLPGVVKVVENGIPVKKIDVKTHFSNTDFKILQLARLDHNKKGQDILLNAIAEFVSHYPEIPISVDFIGDGISKNWLQDLAKSLQIADKCRFLGTMPREYICKHLRDYDLLVQPSRYEGFGLSVAEAMAAQVPVLVADIEGPMEVIGHGKHGYFFKSEDYSDCATVIYKILKDTAEPWFLSTMASRRQWVADQYDVSKTANLYIEEYKILLEAKTCDS